MFSKLVEALPYNLSYLGMYVWVYPLHQGFRAVLTAPLKTD